MALFEIDHSAETFVLRAERDFEKNPRRSDVRHCANAPRGVGGREGEEERSRELIHANSFRVEQPPGTYRGSLFQPSERARRQPRYVHEAKMFLKTRPRFIVRERTVRAVF